MDLAELLEMPEMTSEHDMRCVFCELPQFRPQRFQKMRLYQSSGDFPNIPDESLPPDKI